MDIEITEKQDLFINSKAFETLFGGAAGRRKILWTTDRCISIRIEVQEVKADCIQKNIH